MSRKETPGWSEAHERNKGRFALDEHGVARYDMVFYGDDLVENLNGYAYNKPIPMSKTINNYFKEHFTYESEDSNIDAVALGITGDSVSFDWHNVRNNIIDPEYSCGFVVVGFSHFVFLRTDSKPFVATDQW